MAKGANQKLKLMYLLKILKEETDEEHTYNTAELISRLGAYHVPAERKSIYDDIEQLRQFGCDIILVKKKGGSGYYLGSREFELPELKMLVDVVQASRFITPKKSRELIGKLEQFVSINEGKYLQRDVFVAGRVKSENESIYYNVDFLHRAIREQVQITFRYMEWSEDKRLVPRSGGRLYQISPWVLSWNDENYYLIGYDEAAGRTKHYRVDKMDGIRLTAEPRQGGHEFADFDTAAYSNMTFGMFGGTQENVSITFENKLIGVMIDRFGKEINIRRVDDGHLCIRVRAVVSRQFFGWLSGLGSAAAISGPDQVVSQYCEWLQGLLEKYV